MLRENRDVIKVNLVRVSKDVALFKVGIRHLFAHHLGLGIFELRVSSEGFSKLLILVCVCHFIYIGFK